MRQLLAQSQASTHCQKGVSCACNFTATPQCLVTAPTGSMTASHLVVFALPGACVLANRCKRRSFVVLCICPCLVVSVFLCHFCCCCCIRSRALGTPDYLAPEMLMGLRYGPEVDWWALGIILYEFVYGAPPFNADCPQKIFENILDQQVR